MTAQVGGASPSSQVAFATERNAQRQQLRRMRRALTPAIRQAAERSVARKLRQLSFCKPGARIGVYLALPGELSLQPFIDQAWMRRCQLFVPHITQSQRRQMAFYPLTATSRLRIHPWGISQLLTPQQRVASISLDAVLVPLVGFDALGTRLGMGAGFYDRHFARLQRSHRWRRPRLIGVAFACQQLPILIPQAHDVTLDIVVTEQAILRIR